MIWMLALHIAMLLCWCASLLYFLGLVARICPCRAGDAGGNEQHDLPLAYRRSDSLARFIFTSIATPAAVITIIAGTAVFLMNQTTDPWLIMKLTLVVVLVAGHAVAGGLVLRLEAGDCVRQRALALIFVLAGLMVLIIWTALAKPETGADLWAS